MMYSALVGGGGPVGGPGSGQLAKVLRGSTGTRRASAESPEIRAYGRITHNNGGVSRKPTVPWGSVHSTTSDIVTVSMMDEEQTANPSRCVYPPVPDSSGACSPAVRWSSRN